MRILVGDGDGYPWPADRPWTRVTMLRALDGGVAGPDNRSRSVSSDRDRDVLSEVRRLADAVVVGAGTLRIERYGPMRVREDAVAERRSSGLADAPVLVVVSGSLDLPWDEPVFSESAIRPIVVTAEAADEGAVRRAAERVDLVRLPGGRVGAADLVSTLHERGLRRLVCEGGPGLLRDFAAEGRIDEVDLTVAPLAPTYGPGAGDAEAGAPPPHGFELVQLVEHESFLFARYVRGDGR